MASFCSKCGAELSGETKFCQGCGTPTGFAAAPVAAAGQAPAGQAPAAAAPSSSALKLILIIIGVIGGLGVLSVIAVMFAAWRVSKSVHVDKAGGVTISTPAGKFSTEGTGG